MAFPLGEHRDEHVGAGDLLAAGGLDVDCRPLQHALEARRRLCVVAMGSDEIGELVVDVVQHLAAQAVEVDAAGPQYRDRILVLGQRQQQMLERCVFVAALVGMGESPMQRLFEIA